MEKPPPFFYQALQGRAVPDVLLIHCGGNDLGGDLSSFKLVAVMKDLDRLHLQHPQMKIMFSAITQRCRWKTGANPGKIDKGRRFVNSVMASYLPCVRGTFVNHHHIKFDTPGLFLPDKVHLSNKGNDIFLNSIAESIKAHILQQ